MDKSRRVLDVLNKRVSLIAQMVLFFFATAIFASCSTAKKAEQPKDKYNYRRAIAPASLAFVSGASWGVNQTLEHHNSRFFRAFPKSNERFWGVDSWKNKYHEFDPSQGRNGTPIWFTDGQHLTASLNQTLIFGAGICIPIGKKRPLWHYAADIGITSAAYTLGNALTYNVIFHK